MNNKKAKQFRHCCNLGFLCLLSPGWRVTEHISVRCEISPQNELLLWTMKNPQLFPPLSHHHCPRAPFSQPRHCLFKLGTCRRVWGDHPPVGSCHCRQACRPWHRSIKHLQVQNQRRVTKDLGVDRNPSSHSQPRWQTSKTCGRIWRHLECAAWTGTHLPGVEDIFVNENIACIKQIS